MDTRFLPHNVHWEDHASFEAFDPSLRQLKKQSFVHEPALLQDLPRHLPGIYSLTGGRQVGKTTLLKQWMSELLSARIPPKAIVYITGELIDDQHSLVKIITDLLGEMDIPAKGVQYVLVDEVTYIKNWDKGLKYLADSGMLEEVVLIFTGSDTAVIQQARTRFPGRRGNVAAPDFHLYPLSFREATGLKTGLSPAELSELSKDPRVAYGHLGHHL